MGDNSYPIAELENLASWIRARVVQMSYEAKTPHLASSLSAVDLLVAVYWGILTIDPKNPQDPNRDRFIFSKGHAVSALYATLAKRGFFPLEHLSTFAQEGSSLPEQPAPFCAPGVELATGSLGHGLSVSLRLALAGRIQKRKYRVIALLSDGECNEGSVWEAAMFAPAQRLDNVTVLIDFNKWQATGRSEEVMSLAPLHEKFEAFGWNAFEVNGHDIRAIQELLKKDPTPGKPTAIIAHTTKGKGVSFMEDDNNWHYAIPKEEQFKQAIKELGV